MFVDELDTALTELIRTVPTRRNVVFPIAMENFMVALRINCMNVDKGVLKSHWGHNA